MFNLSALALLFSELKDSKLARRLLAILVLIVIGAVLYTVAYKAGYNAHKDAVAAAEAKALEELRERSKRADEAASAIIINGLRFRAAEVPVIDARSRAEFELLERKHGLELEALALEYQSCGGAVNQYRTQVRKQSTERARVFIQRDREYYCLGQPSTNPYCGGSK